MTTTCMVIDTTIVVPTFNEGGNVAELVRRLARARERMGVAVEVLFVDDSTDDTPAIIEEVAHQAAIPVRLIHRRGPDRVGGLSGAVTRGIREAHGAYVVVMDGDLQHPPEMVPALRHTASAESADVVVATRYCGNGDAAGLSSSWRRRVSSSSTMLARALFPRRVGGRCTDPMTGFFCVAKASIDLASLQPRGFKILLEILARQDLTVREVPFVFGQRLAGDSKASWRQGAAFLRQLTELRLGRVLRFGSIGTIGLVLNLAVMALLVGIDANYVVASLVATELAIVSNFLLQEHFVFADSRAGSLTWRQRAAQSFVFNNLEHLVRVPFLIALVELAGVPSIPVQALTLAVAFAGRYLFVTRVIYRSGPASAAVAAGSVAPVAAPEAELRAA